MEEIKRKIVKTVYEVAQNLSPGYVESVYHNALIIELQQQGLEVSTEVPLQVVYKGNVVGDFRADMIVENKVIIELKAVAKLLDVHEVQLVNYLHTANMEYGFLVNFGENPVAIKRRDLNYSLMKKGYFSK